MRTMMDSMPVDCLLFVFRSLDAAQHCFWKWMDPSHPKHHQCDPGEIEQFKGVIDDVYRTLDDMLGYILDVLRHIPRVGEWVTLPDGRRLTVRRANARAILEVHLGRPRGA